MAKAKAKSSSSSKKARSKKASGTASKGSGKKASSKKTSSKTSDKHSAKKASANGRRPSAGNGDDSKEFIGDIETWRHAPAPSKTKDARAEDDRAWESDRSVVPTYKPKKHLNVDEQSELVHRSVTAARNEAMRDQPLTEDEMEAVRSPNRRPIRPVTQPVIESPTQKSPGKGAKASSAEERRKRHVADTNRFLNEVVAPNDDIVYGAPMLSAPYRRRRFDQSAHENAIMSLNDERAALRAEIDRIRSMATTDLLQLEYLARQRIEENRLLAAMVEENAPLSGELLDTLDALAVSHQDEEVERHHLQAVEDALQRIDRKLQDKMAEVAELDADASRAAAAREELRGAVFEANERLELRRQSIALPLEEMPVEINECVRIENETARINKIRMERGAHILNVRTAMKKLKAATADLADETNAAIKMANIKDALSREAVRDPKLPVASRLLAVRAIDLNRDRILNVLSTQSELANETFGVALHSVEAYCVAQGWIRPSPPIRVPVERDPTPPPAPPPVRVRPPTPPPPVVPVRQTAAPAPQPLPPPPPQPRVVVAPAAPQYVPRPSTGQGIVTAISYTLPDGTVVTELPSGLSDPDATRVGDRVPFDAAAARRPPGTPARPSPSVPRRPVGAGALAPPYQGHAGDLADYSQDETDSDAGRRMPPPARPAQQPMFQVSPQGYNELQDALRAHRQAAGEPAGRRGPPLRIRSNSGSSSTVDVDETLAHIETVSAELAATLAGKRRAAGAAGAAAQGPPQAARA